MRYRHLWPGLTLVTTLVALLAGLLIWGNQLLSPTPSGGLGRLLQGWPTVRETPQVRATDLAAGPTSLAQDGESGTSSRIASEGRGEPAGQGEPKEAVPNTPPPMATRPTPAASPRYALQMGAFVSADEADLIEARLSQAGLSTIRFRHQAAANLYGVLIEPIGSPEEASAVVGRLRRNGLPEGTVLARSQGLAVKVGEPMPLRAAVVLASRLKSAGLEVRIAAQPGRSSQITLRHGNFASREEARQVSEAVSRLGVPNAVVRVR